MVILSVGMVKAGSAWLWNMTNDLYIAAGFDDARVVREKYRLQRVTSEANCNIGDPTTKRMLFAMYPSLFLGRTYTLKTHSGPTPVTRWLSRWNLLKVTYLRRDLRDVILSALDHGQRSREKGIQNPFVIYDSLEVAIPLAQRQAERWQAWQSVPGVFNISYEGLLEDPHQTLWQMAEHLDVPVTKETLGRIVDKYAGGKTMRGKLHYNKGIAGRFRQSFSEDELEQIESQIGPALIKMGYPLVNAGLGD